MAWDTSTRRSRLPSNWTQLRAHARDKAGGRCEGFEQDGSRCLADGSECDHIHPGDNHDPSNLQWLCPRHHGAKTKAESAAARHRYRQRRPAEQHPGLR